MASPSPPPLPPVLTPEEIASLRDAANLTQQIYLLTENRLSTLRAIQDQERDLNTQMQDLLNADTIARNELLDLENRRLEALRAGNLAEAAAREAEIAALRRITEDDRNRARELASQLELLKKEREEIENRARSIERERNLRTEILTGMKDQVAQSIGLGGVVGKLNEGFSLGGALIFQMFENSKKLFDTVLSGNQQFAAATGQIADRSVNFGYGAARFGIGFEQMNKAATELFVNMSNFSNMTKKTQEDLALTAAKMELFGVSASTVAKNLEGMTLALNMTTSEAKNSLETLTKAAMGAGIAPKKMQEEFAANLPRLAAYGKEAVNVYIDLQKQAKSLGIELNTLNGIIGDQFDTFEGAARAAGKFNAVLGGNYLNSVEMLNATESERIILLKKSFEESGKNFDLLSKYEKKAIAATLGISDLNEASKLFNKTTAELEIDMQKRNATDEEQEKIQKEAAETTKQMTEIFNGLLIVIRPLVAIVKFFVDILTSMNDVLGPLTPLFLALIGVMYTYNLTAFEAIYATGLLIGRFLFMNVIMPIVSVVTSVATAIRTLGLSSLSAAAQLLIVAGAFYLIYEWLIKPHSPPLYIVLGMMAGIFMAMGAGANFSSKELTKVGFAIALIGAGIGVAAYGLASFVESFSKLNAAQLVAVSVALYGFGLAVTTIIAEMAALAASGVGEIGVALLLAFGAAAFLIGAGVAIAAFGLSKLVESIGQLMKDLSIENIAKLYMFSGSIAFLAVSLSLIGATALFSTAGLLIIAGAIYTIGDAINEMEENKLLNFKNTMEEFLELLRFEGIKDRTSAITDSISSIAESLNEIPEGKTVALETLNKTLTIAKSITEDNIKPTKDFIQVMKGYYEVQATAKEADKDALVAALKEITGALTAREEQEREVNLVVKGSEMAELFKGKKRTVAGLLTGPVE